VVRSLPPTSLIKSNNGVVVNTDQKYCINEQDLGCCFAHVSINIQRGWFCQRLASGAFRVRAVYGAVTHYYITVSEGESSTDLGI